MGWRIGSAIPDIPLRTPTPSSGDIPMSYAMRSHPYIIALLFLAADLGGTEMLGRIKAAWQVLTRSSDGMAGWGNVWSSSGEKGSSLTRPYAQSVWVQRAIKHVAGPIAAVPLKFGLGDQQDDAIENPELAKWWQHPAIGSRVRGGEHRLLSLYDFIEACVGWLKLRGNVFWIDEEVKLPFPDARKLMQWPKIIIGRPDRMTPLHDGSELIGWIFSDARGRTTTLLPEQVTHLAFWNPYDDFLGLSEMGAAQVAAEADYLTGKFGANLMRANGDRGPFITFKGHIADDKQRDQIIAELKAKRAANLRGESRPTFLSGGDFEIEDPKTQAMDAALISQRLQNRHEIFIAFGVPPSMADIVASYSVGSASDRYLLIEETCMPLAQKLAEHIAGVASKQTGKELSAWFSWDDHSVMRQVRAERIISAKELWAMGMPLQQCSEYLGMSLPEHEGWDTGYLPFSVTPVEMIGQEDPETSEDFAEPTDPMEEAVGALERAFEGKKDAEDVFQRKRDPKQIARWKSSMAGRRASEKSYESGFRAALMQARRETLANLERVRMGSGAVTKGAAADIIFSLVAFTENLTARFRKSGARALQDAGEQVYAELAKDDPWETPAAEVVKFAKSRENKIVGASQEVFDAIQEQIQAGIDLGEPTDKLAARIRGAFNEVGKARAKVIAITETGAAFGQGRHEAMQTAGVKWKQWLTSGNANVRPTHAAANGQTVGITDPFSVGADRLLHPGDPHGSAEEVINCRCVAVAVEAPA